LNTPKVKLKQYYLRRLTRLEPSYFISLFVCAAAQYVTARRGFHDMAPHLLASFFYLHNVIYGAFAGAVNGVAWSLEIEIQFYVLVPLLALLFAISDARLRRTIVITLMLASGMLTNFLYRSPHWHASIIYYVPFFLAGFLLCDLYLSRKDWTRSFVWDVRALCGWPLVWYMGLNSGHVVLPFVIVVLYLAAFRGKVCSAIFSNRVITDIGGNVLLDLCVSFPRHLRGQAPDLASSHRTEFLGLLHTAVHLHHSVGAAILRKFLSARGTPVHGPGVAEKTVECDSHEPDQRSGKADHPRIYRP